LCESGGHRLTIFSLVIGLFEFDRRDVAEHELAIVDGTAARTVEPFSFERKRYHR
jgi:hypothetical protein